MTLRTKLLLAQLPLAVALVGVAELARTTGRLFARSAENVLQDNYRSVLAAERMRDAADQLDRIGAARALGGSGVATASLAAASQRFEDSLVIQEGNITETGEAAMTAALRRAWTGYRAALEGQLAAPVTEAAARYRDQVVTARDEVRARIDDIVAVNQDAMVRKSERAGKEADRRGRLVLWAMLLAFVVGGAASSWFITRLVRPLSVLAQAVRRLGQGDMAARARVDGRDEVAGVATEFNTMADRLATYRKSSLGELLQAQRAAQAAIDSLPDPVVILDLTGALRNANRAAETLLGLSVGGDGAALARADPLVRELIAQQRGAPAGGRPARGPRGLEEAVAVPTHEGPRYLLARASPVVDDDGAAVGLAVVLSDVTRLRRFDELKNDLVATVAHEFRTPLTSLRMAIHLCLEEVVGPLTAKQADLLAAAREDCERLQIIVEDLLDLSRIQSGRIDLDRRPLSPAALLRAAVDSHRLLAEGGQVQLVEAAPLADAQVLGDRDRLQLVLGNLVANALRHTPAGGRVQLGASLAADAVRFTVSDTGPGVAPEHLPRLFDRFFRVPGAPAGGAGLGLYIARSIVEAHDGQIGVLSEPGQGATFWFTIPLAPSP